MTEWTGARPPDAPVGFQEWCRDHSVLGETLAAVVAVAVAAAGLIYLGSLGVLDAINALIG